MPEAVRTLVFTDLVGSTAVKAHLPGADATARNYAYYQTILAPHRERMEAQLQSFGGRIVKTEGDAYFLDFELPAQAVQWAVSVQRSHRDAPIDTPLGVLQVKIGMHTGAPLRDPADPNDFIGTEVDYAARISSLASGGQIVVSEVTASLVRAAAITGLTLHAHNERELKGLGAVPVFEVLYDDEQPRPLQGAVKIQHNLPIPPTPFVGRDRELFEWLDILRDPQTRILTLTGFGGLGKTRVALQLGWLCVEQYPAEFPGGIWWMDLAEARTGEAMVQRMARELNFYIQTPPTAKDQILNFLRDRQPLLILDNTEQIPDAPDIVKELLKAAPRVKCLVTTRKALKLRGEHRIEVLPLPLDEAQRLFVERAREAKADFALTPENAEDVAELCRRLEGVPLALELAASRVTLIAPREILARLEQRFRVLQTRTPDLPLRQRALKATIDWSYELLGEDEKLLFTQLACFARGFTIEDAEAVCDVFDIFESLYELQGQSLLHGETDSVTQQARFFMLESLRDYAAEKLAESPDGGKAIRKRHASYFLLFAQKRIAQIRTENEVKALHELEIGFDNAVTAVEWAGRAGEDEVCARLALVLAIYLTRRGFVKEALRYIEIGQRAAHYLPVMDVRLIAELWRERAGLHLDEREPEPAREAASEALRFFEELGDQSGQAQAYNILALADREEQHFQAARERLLKALDIFKAANDVPGMAAVLTNLAVIWLENQAGSADETVGYLKEALQLRRKLGDKRGIAEVSVNYGFLISERGEIDEAWKYYAESLSFECELGHVFGAGRSLYNMAELAEIKNDLPRAYHLFAGAKSLFGKVGSPYLPYAAESLEKVADKMGLDTESLTNTHRLLQDKPLDELVNWALTDKN